MQGESCRAASWQKEALKDHCMVFICFIVGDAVVSTFYLTNF